MQPEQEKRTMRKKLFKSIKTAYNKTVPSMIEVASW